MIITLTANPSLDRSVTLGTELVPGGVHRIVNDVTQPGGKGINVAFGVARAHLPVLAILGVAADDPLLTLLAHDDLPFRVTPTKGRVRTNLTVLADGETTKINEPGAVLSPEEIAGIEEQLVSQAEPDTTFMLSGSLAPGFPVDEYARLIRRLRPSGAWIGVDTSDEPLAALAENFADAAPDFLKPNAEELGQLTGRDGVAIEEAAKSGDISGAREAAQALHDMGVSEVLVTLGAAGGILVTDEGVWYSTTPRLPVVSTVGAGDSATAGYLIAREKGLSPAERLAYAIGYGSVAVSLPGTTIPRPDQVEVQLDLVSELA